MTNAQAILTALGDPTRQAILDLLLEGPQPVGELAALLPVSRPAVSQHLKVLKEVGLVVDRQEGTRRVYRVDPAGLAPVRAYLDRFWKKAMVAFAQYAEEQAETGRPATRRRTDDPADHQARARERLRGRSTRSAAFEVFADEMTSWWPAGHHIGEAPIQQVVVEPFVGGRWYTRHTDGSETETGVVTAYDAAERLHRHLADRRRLGLPRRPGDDHRGAVHADRRRPHPGRAGAPRPRGVRRRRRRDAGDLRGPGRLGRRCSCTTREVAEAAASGLAAVRAGPEDLQGVAHLGEAVLGGDRPGPALDGRPLDLDGPAAAAADQVVVVGVGAAPVDRLAVLGAQHVDLAGVGEPLQGPVDGGQPDRLAAPAEQVVDLLGRAEVVEGVHRLDDREPLLRRPHRADCGPSVLVIVRSVLGVPVAVVDVVDVVAVPDRDVAAVRAVLVGVLVGGLVLDRLQRHAGNGARSRCRGRSQTPSGQVTAKPASESSTIVGPGATRAS